MYIYGKTNFIKLNKYHFSAILIQLKIKNNINFENINKKNVLINNFQNEIEIIRDFDKLYNYS